MNFRRGRMRDEPEINFIPLIDVLLVILIFLMVTTSYSHVSELEVNLPTGGSQAVQAKENAVTVQVSSDGHIKVGTVPVPAGNADALTRALAAAAAGKNDTVVTIDADARATHQSVVDVMEAARAAGLTQLTFATRAVSR